MRRTSASGTMPRMDLTGVMLIPNRLDDGRMLALHTPWDPSITAEGGSGVTLLEVASVLDEVSRLQGTTIEVSEPHDIPGGRVVTMADPDGRLVQLIEHDTD
jgi:hypothetical protein